MSGSVRRFADGLNEALGRGQAESVTGADAYGPIEFVESQPGYYWYGIHIVDVVYRVLGQGCRSVTAFSEGDSENVTAVWADGRVATLRGNRRNAKHAVTIHRETTSEYVDTAADQFRKYANLLESVLTMFRTGKSGIEPKETLEIIRFIEAVNESRVHGRTIAV
jgi:hypothetical protein